MLQVMDAFVNYAGDKGWRGGRCYSLTQIISSSTRPDICTYKDLRVKTISVALAAWLHCIIVLPFAVELSTINRMSGNKVCRADSNCPSSCSC